MQSNSDIFLEEREENEMGSYFADQALDNQQQEMERILSEDQWEEEQIEKINNEAYEDFLNSNKSSLAVDLFKKGSTKTEIKNAVREAVESVLENGNVLQVAESLSAMELFIKELKADKRYSDYVREEASKTPKGYVSNSGAKIELAETGSAYDYSKCDDPILKDIEQRLSILTEAVTNRKDFLKTIPRAGIEVVIVDEVVKLYPPSKSSNSSFKVTLAK